MILSRSYGLLKINYLEGEIGDTWIHGVATDPYKTGAFKELCALKSKWLDEGSLTKGSTEYNAFCDSLICVAEHTWGMDMKKFFGDYEHYLKKQFVKARQDDRVKMHHPFRDFPINFVQMNIRRFGGYETGSYRAIEESWSEQRNYLNDAVSSLNDPRKEIAKNAISKLKPTKTVDGDKIFDINSTINSGDISLKINEFGGIGSLKKGDKSYFTAVNAPAIEYVSYGKKDYKFWLDNYTRNYAQTWSWAVGDFSRPLLKYVDKKFSQGRFAYKVVKATEKIHNNDSKEIILTLKTEESLCVTLGAPRIIQIVYLIVDGEVKINLLWLEKDANRLTESLHFRLFPTFNSGNLKYIKIGSEINPYSVVDKGSKNLSATEGVKIDEMLISNLHSPLTALGRGKILHFDDKYEEPSEGISFILYNNVWGTNFPLWYEDNASFSFVINFNKKK